MRLSDEKNPLLWLEVAAKVHAIMPQTHFLMIGDGWLQAQVQQQINKLNLTAAMHWLKAEKNILAAMAAMDLFLLTSRAEGLPNVLIEAQAMGTPVITTDVGGAAETVAHQQTGWVLANHHAADIANIVLQLLADTAWRAQAKSQARYFVEQRFGLARMLHETLQSYSSSQPELAQVEFE